MGHIVMWKDRFAIFKVKVTGKAHNLMTVLAYICWTNQVFSQPDLIGWYIIS